MCPSEAFATVLEEADRLVKRQKVCSTKTTDVMNSLIEQVEKCIEAISSSEAASVAQQQIVERMLEEVEKIDAVGVISKTTKELHGSVSKLGKAVEKAFSLDIMAAMRETEMDKDIIDKIVAGHFYHEGNFVVADALAQEAGMQAAPMMKAPYETMHSILLDIRKRELASVCEWTQNNLEALRNLEAQNTNPGSPGSHLMAPCAFEFYLHRLRFIQELDTHGSIAALEYAREHFPSFLQHGGVPANGVKHLMGALVYFRRFDMLNSVAIRNGGEVSMEEESPISKEGPSPMSVDHRFRKGQCILADRYADLFKSNLWDEFEQEFRRQCCALLDQAQHSPLLVTVAAGAAALPTLLKLAAVVAKTQPAAELAQNAEELPVEVPLGSEFVFHSIFACPVSREQSSPENPPMMLPCGHCICRTSILRISKSSTRSFKCPYCPTEANLSRCLELKLPDKLEGTCNDGPEVTE